MQISAPSLSHTASIKLMITLLNKLYSNERKAMNIENLELNKTEKSLLLFFESCSVEYGGKVNTTHMNNDDFDIAKRWNKSDFINFGRISFNSITKNNSHWVKLSPTAWSLAHKERIARFNRLWNNRTWETTDE